MNEERLLKTLLAPHLSEKASVGSQGRNQYIFHVHSAATKPEVKMAVEELFNAKVDSVNIVNTKTKIKRFGGRIGKTKAWKKAYVTLQAGQQIDFPGTS